MSFPHGPEILPMIRQLLSNAGANFREVHHEPTRTSEESAKARGEELHIGARGQLGASARERRGSGGRRSLIAGIAGI